MAREFAAKFYKSKEWLKCRQYIYDKYFGLCTTCGNAGLIVHHIIHLSPNNMNDMSITLGEDNLTLLCLDCHNRIHGTQDDYFFDENGDLLTKS